MLEQLKILFFCSSRRNIAENERVKTLDVLVHKQELLYFHM